MTFRSFRCGDCGGAVRLLPGRGEPREYRAGRTMAIPSSIKVPRCVKCSAIYFDPDEARRVDQALTKLARTTRVPRQVVNADPTEAYPTAGQEWRALTEKEWRGVEKFFGRKNEKRIWTYDALKRALKTKDKTGRVMAFLVLWNAKYSWNVYHRCNRKEPMTSMKYRFRDTWPPLRCRHCHKRIVEDNETTIELCFSFKRHARRKMASQTLT